MRNDRRYARQILARSVAILCGDGDLRDRLAVAGTELANIRGEHLPSELVGRFTDLRGRLTVVDQSGDEGSIRASVMAMKVEDRIEIAESIAEMLVEVVDCSG